MKPFVVVVLFCALCNQCLAVDNVPTSEAMCGPNCLFIALSALKFSVPEYSTFQSEFKGHSASGVSLGEIKDVAERFGAKTLLVRTECRKLAHRERPFACIAFVNGGHFVLITDATDSSAVVVDPPRVREIPIETLSMIWKGEALLLSRTELEEENRVTAHSRWTLWSILAVASIGGVWFCLRRLR